MKPVFCAASLAMLLVGGQATAEVTDATAGGFTTVNEVLIDAPPAEAWRIAVDEIGHWWSSSHTVSGDARRLSIEAKPQGCFCERLGEDAGVVHLTVTMVSPGIVLRMTGGLGPLGLMGVNGNMTWEFDAEDDGTRARFSYVVGGYYTGGLDTIAAAVDGVIGEALLRLKAYSETGDAGNVGVE
jgi:uncharacterized protein YndB with AHSA1/START domain